MDQSPKDLLLAAMNEISADEFPVPPGKVGED